MSEQPRTPGRDGRVAGAAGADLALVEYGAADAPPVVLLHGIGSRGASFWPVIDDLAARFRLLVLDLRGHGGSAKPGSGYLLPDYAADLDAALGALALGRPRLLGHSLGGLVALEWATRQPARAAAIVVEDPPLRTWPGVLEAFDGWQRLAAAPIAEAAAYYHQEHPEWSDEACWRRAEAITATTPAVFAELRAEAAARLASGAVERFADLAAIRTPTLLAYGDPAAGGMLDHDDAVRFQERAAAVELVRMPGAGHALHRERTAAFLAAVVPFLLDAGETGSGAG
jgi:pimeloyl-ACP methyl ester carboxylesterase